MSERLTRIVFALARSATGLAAAILITIAVIKYGHGHVISALLAMWDGALGVRVVVHRALIPGTRYALLIPHGFTYDRNAISTTLVRTCPLLLTGLGLAIAFRARMWNIGGQGQFLAGAILASYCATNCPVTRHLPRPFLLTAMMAAGIVAGGLWGGMTSLLRTWRGVPEVISTIMLNFVAIFLLSYLVNGPLQRADHSQPATEELGLSATLPILIPQSSLHAGLIIVIAAAIVVYVLLRQTTTGFAIRVVGASPEAAGLYGFFAARVMATAMLWSGGLCGLAGAIELSGVIGNLPEGYAPEYGFTAIAVALLGRLEVGGIVIAALLFGALAAGSENMERTAGIPHELGFVIQATLLIVFLAMPAIKWLRDREEAPQASI